jgi:superfamily II DNA/RNA helicase
MPWIPEWLQVGAKSLDHWPHFRRQDMSIDGDGFLKIASIGIFTRYKSLAQRTALHLAMSMPKGGTLMTILPTNEGKSLIGIADAVQRVQSGMNKCGTNVVIVPTVSLALDQQRNAHQFFRELPLSKWPGCYSTSDELEKQRVRKGVIEGTLPVVYTNPESIIRGGLRSAIEIAAQSGTLETIVLDEVHILESWGECFRPEFIWLASLRKQLLEASGRKLRTILLSATISKHCEGMLEDIFKDEKGPLCVVDGKALRPEPEFWTKIEKSWQGRRDHLRDLVFHLPRPIIIYATQIEDVERWVRYLGEWGFRRVASFSGDTDEIERPRLVEKWKNDEIDIMVATSAFGLGIDKPDVRAIIHTCLPEGIDRFYQEVGRGGRDGFASLSILLPVKLEGKRDDWSIGRSLAGGKSLNEKLMPRWRALWTTRTRNQDGSFNVSLDALHEDIEQTSDENRRWNRSLLGSLVKIGFIDLVPPCLDNDEEEMKDKTLIGLKVLNGELLRNEMRLEKELRDQRERETNSRLENFELMRKIADEEFEDCIGHMFMDAYGMNYGIACGGCQVCRKNSEEGTELQRLWPIVENAWHYDFVEVPIHQKMKRFIEPYSEVILTHRPEEKHFMQQIIQLINLAARNGVQQFILDRSRYEIIKTTLSVLQNPWSILTHEEILENEFNTGLFINVSTFIFYEAFAPTKMERLFLWQERALDKTIYKIHLIPENLAFPKDGGRLISDLINCNHYIFKNFIEGVSDGLSNSE